MLARFRSATTLEAFVKDAAINLLERVNVSGAVSASVLSDADNAAIDADQVELAELSYS
jgi:site-specific DNA recombinase